MMLSCYTGGSDSVQRRFLLTLAGVLRRGSTSRLLANPEGLTVASGSASVQQQGSSLNLTVSQGAVLNWQHVNIRPGETTTLHQPNSASIVWNRILDANPSLESQNLSQTDVSTLKVGGNVSLNAGRNTEAIVVARGSLNIQSVQSANVVALASGGISLGAGGSVSGPLVNEKDLKKDEEGWKKKSSSFAVLKRSAGLVTVILSQN